MRRRAPLILALASLVGTFPFLPTPARAAGPAVGFSLGATPNKLAGVSFSLAVNALGADSNPTADYRGTIRFTSSDPLATLPGDYTYNASDAGSHSFPGVTLRSEGSQTITVTDAAQPSVTASRNFNVTIPVARVLEVGTVGMETVVGYQVGVLVKAVHGPGIPPDPDYRGTVRFTSATDPSAVLPVDYTFTEDDRGEHLFCPAGNGVDCSGGAGFSSISPVHTVTVTDTTTPSITGTSNTVDVSSAEVTSLLVEGSALAVTGGEALVAVTALNDVRRIVPTYRGTVGITSTDPLAVLPPDHTYVPRDRGRREFFVVMGTVGTFTFTAFERANPSVRGTGPPVSVSFGTVVTAPPADLRSVASLPPTLSTVPPSTASPGVTAGPSGASGVVTPVRLPVAASSAGAGASPPAATTTSTVRAVVGTTPAPSPSAGTAGTEGRQSLARTGVAGPEILGIASVVLAVGTWLVVAARAGTPSRRPSSKGVRTTT